MLSTDPDPDPDADPDLRSLSCSWSLSEVNMLIWGLHDYLDHDPDMTSWYWPNHGVLTLILILILILIWGPDPYDILILILILILLLIMIWGPDPDSNPDIFLTLTLTFILILIPTWDPDTDPPPDLKSWSSSDIHILILFQGWIKHHDPSYLSLSPTCQRLISFPIFATFFKPKQAKKM